MWQVYLVFWTFSYLTFSSMSNLPRLLIPFGLQHTFPPLQHPIHRVSTPTQKGVEFFAPLRSAQSRGPLDLVRPCPKTRLRHVLSINKTPLWSIGKRERRSSRFLTPFSLWTRGESNLSSNSCIP